MPRRTTDFQELITLLVQTLGEDRATPSAMVRSKVPGVRKREVDIRVQAEVDGVPCYIGIEVSESRSRPKTVEWVERMNGKHQHLSTSKLVLVSSSGFSKGALKLAEYYEIEAITPEEVTPGFVGEIVNNLDSLWLETLNFTAELAIIDFDPPIKSPQGPIRSSPLPPEAWGASIHRADSTEFCTVGQLIDHWLHDLDISEGELRRASGKRNQFKIVKTSPLTDGEPMFLRASDGVEPHTPRRINRVVIVGKLDVTGIEMPLKHGHLDGTNFSNGVADGTDFSNGVAVLDDLKFHWAVTEGDSGKRVGTRIAPVDDPHRATAATTGAPG